MYSLCLLLASAAADTGAEIVDVFGNTALLTPQSRIVCGYASFAECWQLSGGKLAGVTEDAITEHGLKFEEQIEVVGTVKHIDLEKLIALAPDYVILSADLTAHFEMEPILRVMGIPYGYFRVDTFEDYSALMRQFCDVSGREDLYQINVSEVQDEIRSILDASPIKTDQSFLLLRAFSSGLKAKTDDNLAGRILKEFGLTNIADAVPSLLEDLSMERILLDDPEYVFVLTMGDEQAAREYLTQNVESDPAWASLRAVREGRYIVLPQELFHYKPNARWAESYRYIAQVLYPALMEEGK